MTTGTSNSSTLMRQLGSLAIVIAYLLFIPMVVLQDLIRLREFPAFEDIAEEESSGNSSSNQTDDKRKEFDNFKKNVDVKNAFGVSSYLGLYQVDVDSGGNVTFKLGVLSNCQDVCGWQFKVGLQCVHAAVAVAVFAAFVSISTRIYLFQGKGEINKVVFFKTASAELASGALLLFGMFLLMLLVSTMAVDTAFGVSVYLGIASGLAYMIAGNHRHRRSQFTRNSLDWATRWTCVIIPWSTTSTVWPIGAPTATSYQPNRTKRPTAPCLPVRAARSTITTTTPTTTWL
ncbi:uncharacterized protein LOC143449622 [Clavelina lepadiformis]|uniref:uncharacterized protein LOC143449622 n=1 Tax=Clavelina lepadiformis TaxID=159417 RepID=UPI0040422831